MSVERLREFEDETVVHHDPVLRWVLNLDGSLAQRAGRLAVLTLFLPFVLVCISLFVDHNFYLQSGAIGLSQDWNIISMFVVFPSALLILSVIVKRFGSFLRSIPDQTYHSADIQNALTVAYDRIAGMFRAKGNWAAIKFLFFFIGIAYVIYNAYNRCYRPDQMYFSDFWTSCDYPTTFWVTNAYTSLVWGYLVPSITFVVSTIVIAVAIIAGALRRQSALRLKLLSADRMGGLRPISNLALSLSYIIIPFQLQLVAYFFWIPERYAPFYIGLLFVVFLSALLFSIPIYYIHRAMRQSKIAALEDLGLEARENYVTLRTSWGKKGDPAKEVVTFERLKQIKKVYDMVDATEVWPFDMRAVGRVFVVNVLPLIAIALKLLYDW